MRRPTAIVLLLVSLGSPAGAVAEDWYARQRAGAHQDILLARGQAAAPPRVVWLGSLLALGRYGEVLDAVPTTAPVAERVLRGEALCRGGAAAAALAELGEGGEDEPLPLQALRVDLLADLGRTEEATAIATRVLGRQWRALRAEDADPDEVLACAAVLWRTQQQQAFELADRLIGDPRLAQPARILIGRIALACSELAEVRRQTEALLAEDPAQTEALLLQAAVEDQRDPDRARSLRRQALEREPRRVGLLLACADDALAVGDVAATRALLATLGEQAAEHPELAVLQACLGEIRGHGAAEQLLDGSLGERARRRLVWWCWQRGRALAARRLAAELPADDWEAGLLGGLADLALGDGVAARQRLEAAFKANDYHKRLYNLLVVLDREADARHWQTRQIGRVSVLLRGEAAWVCAPWETWLRTVLAELPGGPDGAPLVLVLCPDAGHHRARLFGRGDGLGAVQVGATVVAREPDHRLPGSDDFAAIAAALWTAALQVATAERLPPWVAATLRDLSLQPDRDVEGIDELQARCAADRVPGLPGLVPGEAVEGDLLADWQRLVLARALDDHQAALLAALVQGEGWWTLLWEQETGRPARASFAISAGEVAAALLARPTPIRLPADAVLPELPDPAAAEAWLAEAGVEQALRLAWSLGERGRREQARHLTGALQGQAPDRALIPWLAAEDAWAAHADAERASRLLFEALGRDQDHYPSLLLGCAIAAKTGDQELIAAFIARALGLGDMVIRGIDPLVIAAEHARRCERPLDAIGHLRTLSRRRPQRIQTYVDLARLQAAQGQAAAARETVERALRRRLLHAGLLDLAAELAQAAGDAAAAQAWTALRERCAPAPPADAPAVPDGARM